MRTHSFHRGSLICVWTLDVPPQWGLSISVSYLIHSMLSDNDVSHRWLGINCRGCCHLWTPVLQSVSLQCVCMSKEKEGEEPEEKNGWYAFHRQHQHSTLHHVGDGAVKKQMFVSTVSWRDGWRGPRRYSDKSQPVVQSGSPVLFVTWPPALFRAVLSLTPTHWALRAFSSPGKSSNRFCQSQGDVQRAPRTKQTQQVAPLWLCSSSARTEPHKSS